MIWMRQELAEAQLAALAIAADPQIPGSQAAPFRNRQRAKKLRNKRVRPNKFLDSTLRAPTDAAGNLLSDTTGFPPHDPGTLSAADTWSALPNNNPFINGLLTGAKWGRVDPDSGSTTELAVYFHGAGTMDLSLSGLTNLNTVTTYAWSIQEQSAADAAMQGYEAVANVRFTPTTLASLANIRWALLDSTDQPSTGNIGYAFTPETGAYQGLTTLNRDSYLANINAGALEPGSLYAMVFGHELGHSLGLKHPHERDQAYAPFPGVTASNSTGSNNLNSSPWTVMTYNLYGTNTPYMAPTGENFGRGHLIGPGAFDIAAAQYLYGANTNHNTTNNTYYLDRVNLNGYSCIWDNGGSDTISAALADTFVAIDLRNATLLNSTGGGGFVSRIGSEYAGFTIAYNATGNCIIENAIGSAFADTMRGNSSNNMLDGGGGTDTALFLGRSSDYSFALDSKQRLLVRDGAASRDGTDTLINVENLRFTDSTLVTSEIINGLSNPGTGNTTAPPTQTNNSGSGGGGGGVSSSGASTAPALVAPEPGSEASSNSNSSSSGEPEFTPSTRITGNRITGDAGDNQLYPPNPGRWILTGRAGADTFVFSVKEKRSKRNADTLTDYNRAEGDTIALLANIFPEIVKNGIRFQQVRSKKQLKQASRQKSNLIYQQRTGHLLYDDNGQKDGLGARGGLFAICINTASLRQESFTLLESISILS